MLKKCLIVFTAILLVGSTSVSAGVIYSADFESGTVEGFTDGAFSNTGGGAGPNADSPTVDAFGPTGGLGGTSGGLELGTIMFDSDNNPSWAGTQVSSPAIPGSGFAGLSPSNVTIGFDFSVIADPGVNGTLRFELREGSNGATHGINIPVTDITGGETNFSFTLDQNTQNGFTAFDVNENYQIFVQVPQDWALSGSERNVDLVMDNFSLTMPMSVPEPTSVGLVMFAGLGLVARRRRQL